MDTGLMNEAKNYLEGKIMDLKEQMKNEFKIRLADNMKEMEVLSSRVAALEKENQKLKSTVGDLKKSISLLTKPAKSSASPPSADKPLVSSPDNGNQVPQVARPPQTPPPSPLQDAEFPPLTAVTSRPPPESWLTMVVAGSNVRMKSPITR